MHIRFLTPFALFLALFFVSGAVAYYFHNEKMRLDFEIKRIQTEELSVSGTIFKGAKDQEGELKETNDEKGLINASKRVPSVADPAGDLRGANYISGLKQINVWLRTQTDRMRKYTHIKSQHSVDFGGVTALEPGDQVKRAKEWIDKVNDALAPAVEFATVIDASKPGSGVIADRPILSTEDKDLYTQLRTKVEQQRSEIAGKISEIRGSLKTIDGIVTTWQTNKRATSEQLKTLRAEYAKAAAANYAILKLMSYATVKINGADKEVPIPGLIDSPLKRAAVQLSFYLLTADTEALRRPAPGEDALPGEISATNPAAEIAYRSLVEDFFKSSDARLFNLQPYYLAATTMEDVIDNQDILITALVNMNHMLAKELMLQLATYHRSQSDRLSNGDPNDRSGNPWKGIKQMVNRNEQENSGNNDRVVQAFADWKSAEDDLATGSVSDKSTISTDVNDGMNTFLSGIQRQIDEHNKALIDAKDKLTELFYKLKPDSFRLDGTLKLGGTDGKIVYLNNDDQVYHIDLGSGDNIRLGMRFVVLSELGGKTELKGLIEVVQIPAKNFSICRLVSRYANSEIQQGDLIENRLYKNRRYLKVACIGDFQAPYSYLSQEQIEQYLRDLGCEVQKEPDVDSELVIRAEPPEKLVPSDERRRRYIQLRERVKLDEIEPSELTLYFQDK